MAESPYLMHLLGQQNENTIQNSTLIIHHRHYYTRIQFDRQCVYLLFILLLLFIYFDYY